MLLLLHVAVTSCCPSCSHRGSGCLPCICWPTALLPWPKPGAHAGAITHLPLMNWSLRAGHGAEKKEVTPCSSSATKAAAWREQVVSDSALRTFVLVALAQHQVLGTSAPAMPIPCSAPFCFPSHATCPQATPCPQEGCHGHGYWCHNGSHGEDRSWVRWKSQQREITNMQKMEQHNPGGIVGGLEIQVPAGHNTAPLQPPRAAPCSITKPAASHLQHRAPGEGSAGCRG